MSTLKRSRTARVTVALKKAVLLPIRIDFQFADTAGTLLGRAAILIPINLPAGATPAALVFKVLGVTQP